MSGWARRVGRVGRVGMVGWGEWYAREGKSDNEAARESRRTGEGRGGGRARQQRGMRKQHEE